MIRHLFVYGTLLSTVGAPAHRILRGRARLVGRARVAGRLYDAGDYPAAVASDRAGEHVQGELYALGSADAEGLVAELDAYEGFHPDAPHRSLFRREAVDATLEDGRALPAWTYRYGRPVDALPRIASGDYAAASRRDRAGP